MTCVDLQTLLTFASTLMVIWLVKVTWFSTPKNLPPFPERPLPIFGHVFKLMKDPRRTLKEWREKTGDLFCYYVGAKLFVVVNGYELHKEVFVKHADQFTDRPDNLLFDIPDANRGISNSSGPDWKEQRGVALTILRAFGMGKNILAVKIAEEVSVYLNCLSNLQGTATDVHTLTSTSVSNVICSIVVGQRFEYDDPYFLKFLNGFDERVKRFGTASLIAVCPWLKYLPGDLFYFKWMSESIEGDAVTFSDRFIREQGTSQALENEEKKSFIKEYLKEMKRRQSVQTHTYLDKTSLRRTILTLFLAGSETTNTTLLWFMLYMVNYPDIQKKIYDSIDRVVGTNRMPTLQDRSSLNYLNAAIMETQRITSIVSFGLYHKCSQTVNIRGYTIPEGATVIPFLDSVLLDPKTWEDPYNFRPERFLNASGDLVQPEEFIPFSIGRRICLGEALAKMELFLFGSALLQRFELLPEVGAKPPPLEYQPGFVNGPKHFKIRFVERCQM